MTPILVAMLASSFIGLAPQQSDQAKVIERQLGTLRSLPDTERAELTMKLAGQIQRLPAGADKIQAASGLCNLATEGDFGDDTLQAVADALATAVRETPISSTKGEIPYAYTQLAQLARYEHRTVKLENPNFAKAMNTLAAIDKKRQAIDFKLTDMSGHEWKRAELKGKVVLLNFWATWGPPCRKEMPDLEKLYNEFKAKGFVVLAVSDEEASKVNPFIAEHKYTFPVALDAGRALNTEFGVDGIPKSFVYDRSGKIVATAIDMRTENQMRKMLARAGLK